MPISICIRDINGKKECLEFKNESEFHNFNWGNYDDENYKILLVVYRSYCIYSSINGDKILFSGFNRIFCITEE